MGDCAGEVCAKAHLFDPCAAPSAMTAVLSDLVTPVSAPAPTPSRSPPPLSTAVGVPENGVNVEIEMVRVVVRDAPKVDGVLANADCVKLPGRETSPVVVEAVVEVEGDRDGVEGCGDREAVEVELVAGDGAVADSEEGRLACAVDATGVGVVVR